MKNAIAFVSASTCLLALAACASSATNVECSSREWLAAIPEASHAQLSEIKPRYLKVIDLDGEPKLPESARGGAVKWIENEIARVSSKRQPGDELWHFREEKCDHCHWYREGYALIRGCEIVDEITISDDM